MIINVLKYFMYYMIYYIMFNILFYFSNKQSNIVNYYKERLFYLEGSIAMGTLNFY